jgi:uncharacterized membrane protein YeaQ/YmgE (transglycosylase-associated protein family)
MIWTTTNLVIQVIAGVFGAHIAAGVAREHSFGFLGHTASGAVGGALSGYFLQMLALTVVTASGSLNEPRPAEIAMLQGLTGLTAGACLTLIAGLIKHGLDHRTSRED